MERSNSTEDEKAREERLREARETVAASAILGLFSSPDTAEDLMILQQERMGLKDKVQRAIGRRDEKDRALVWSCVCEGCQVTGVAETLGLDYDNARHRLRTALRSLSRWLKAP